MFISINHGTKLQVTISLLHCFSNYPPMINQIVYFSKIIIIRFAYRMTMIDATTSLGTVVGSMLCTSLILTIGTTNVLLLAATISVISYAFTNIWIQESLRGALEVYIIVHYL